MATKGTAFVTGAARGIGKGIALRLADDGYDIAVNDVESSKNEVDEVVNQIKSKGRRSIGVLGDVSNEDIVKRMIGEAVKELGRLDVMIANAAIVVVKLLHDTTVEEWDRLYAINVRGTFLCFKYAALQMMAQGKGGRLIAACSVSGKKGLPEQSLYASSKFAVRGIIQSAAQEYGKYGITVNGYAPAAIETGLIATIDDYYVKKDGLKPGEWTKALKNGSCVGRNGTPQDVANLVSFFASQTSSFVTGQSVLVDGGTLFD